MARSEFLISFNLTLRGIIFEAAILCGQTKSSLNRHQAPYNDNYPIYCPSTVCSETVSQGYRKQTVSTCGPPLWFYIHEFLINLARINITARGHSQTSIHPRAGKHNNSFLLMPGIRTTKTANCRSIVNLMRDLQMGIRRAMKIILIV